MNTNILIRKLMEKYISLEKELLGACTIKASNKYRTPCKTDYNRGGEYRST